MVKFELRKILDSPFFSELQNQMALVTGVSINTVDYKGTPLLKNSGCSAFCEAIRNHPVSGPRCRKCDALAGLEAVRQDQPYAYFCHCGLVDVAIPILFGDQYLGAVIFGQVRLSEENRTEEIHRLIREKTNIETDCPEITRDLLAGYEALPIMEYERIMEVAELIHMIISYIVAQRATHYNDRITYEWMLNNGTYPHNSRAFDMVEEYAHHGHHLRIRQQEEPENALPVLPNSVIYPAVSYIHQHPKEKISMQSMADLCHLSPSYFSRIFQRDVGENFNEYVNHQKVLQAKDMIRNTNQSISAIASSLGFRDTSYFIQVFKKFENITPQEYKTRR